MVTRGEAAEERTIIKQILRWWELGLLIGVVQSNKSKSSTGIRLQSYTRQGRVANGQ